VALRVVGAGVGRTATHSLKVALERLIGGKCHHMLEVFADPRQVSGFTDAIEGKPVDWAQLMSGFTASVDWPSASFWPELSEANPDALVLLSVRDAEDWYRSASNTIFLGFELLPPEMRPWMDEVRKLLRDRFSDRLDDSVAMIDAYERHNEAVRRSVPPERLLEWRPEDGWDPICERLGVSVPDEPFPVTNTMAEMRAMLGLPPIE
jgi:hypothetical protein